MRVLILCGGQGTRLREETEWKPKPLVEIGGRPILWHIMKGYAQHGLRDFVLLLGYKGEMIKRYFLDYHLLTSDITVKLGKRDELHVHGRGQDDHDVDWSVTMVDTGTQAMTGARIARARRHIEGERFMLTYGDGVCDLDLKKLEEHHRRHGKLATVQGERVARFAEKPSASGGYINGGFFVFERGFLDYLATDDDCILESKPLERAAAEGQLHMYPHDGFWHCMDTLRDVNHLNELWASGHAPWKTWADGG